MATKTLMELPIDDGSGSEVFQNRRLAERVQDAVGLQITRLLDQPVSGDSLRAQNAVENDISHPTHKISLSEAGVAFAYDAFMQPGELIVVNITLFPSCHRIQADGRIVSANDALEIADGDKPTYRVAFESISDADRDAIAAQVKALAAQRPIVD